MSEYAHELEVRDASGLRLAVAKARFNDHVTSGLAAGAVEYLERASANYRVFDVPGAFELPLIARKLIESGFDAVIALGAVIDGETDHYDHVAHRASEGLMQVMLETGRPVAFGILTVRDEKQAVARSEPGPGNKGAEAAAAAVETALLMNALAREQDID
ncbi:MAG: 6,7-dimethyl-8-ribityllumazine synthase [Acidimicrobiia bacterium]|nr:6,7-dimethyl-8-ribityllumazine synthase [Acidimicrobiia bacterium]